MHAVDLCNSWMGFHPKRGHTSLDIDKQVRAGLPYAALDKLEAYLAVNAKEISKVLMIPHRTLLRRKKTKRFSMDESDRVYRLARVVALAHEILGSETKAKGWLKTPNPALSDKPPLYFLETNAGTEEVTKLLQRFAYGVFY